MNIDDIRRAMDMMRENDRLPLLPIILSPEEAKRLGVSPDNPSFKIIERKKL